MDWDRVAGIMNEQPAALVIQHPNFWGHLESGKAADLIHQAGIVDNG